jgi:hypothetical protein
VRRRTCPGFNTILGWAGPGPYQWLQSATTAMPSLVLEATWAAAGDTVIISLAALIGVPAELYDAADVDGASIWRKIWHITLPQLRGVLLVTPILQVIGTSQVFLEPFLFTGGGAANSTLTVLLLIHNYAFDSSLGGDHVAATALSLMLAVFLAACTTQDTLRTPMALFPSGVDRANLGTAGRECTSICTSWCSSGRSCAAQASVGAQGIPVIAARRARSPREGRSATVRGDQRKKRRDRSGRRRALRLSHRSLQERQGSPSGAHIGAAATMWPQTAE